MTLTPTVKSAAPESPENRGGVANRATPARFAHLRALDGLRGIAVLVVVLYHFAPDVAPGGFLGVDLFFVLSGFLITSLLVNELHGTHRISPSSFWGRRARRLLPALFVVLGAVAVYALVFLPDEVDAQRLSVDGLSALAYVANWHFIDSGQAYIQQFFTQVPSPLRHTWSLAIEEQFYLVWPLIVVLVAKVVGNPRRRNERVYRNRLRFALVSVCVVLGVASFFRMLTLFQPGGDINRVYYGTDSRAFVVLVGATLGALCAGTPTVLRALRAPLIAVGTACGIALLATTIFMHADSSWLYEGGYGLIAILMVVVLAAAAQPGVNQLASVLKLRPLVGLGIISYGVYLWHWPIGLWVTPDNTGFDGLALFVVRVAITLAAALLSYVLVEQPIRRGRLPNVRLVTPGLVTAALGIAVAIPLVASALTLPTVRALPDEVTSAPPSAAVKVTEGYAGAPRCDGPSGTPVVPGKKILIQLEGNSIAGELRSCLAAIFESRGATFETVNPPDFFICREVPAIQDQARATRPDAAILFLFVAGDTRCGDPWHAPVDKLVATWKAVGTHVFLVPSVPFAPGSPKEQDLGPGPLLEAEYYRKLADADPEHITYVDAGVFLRDSAGTYLWRMPCLAGGEAGCDAQNTVGIRFTDGFHYCTDPDYAAHGCIGAEHQAGERRASAAVAAAIVEYFQTSPSFNPPI
ncbi:MAG: acyltransferase [Acidimicrobiia bacterium]